jgi:hypothetical protein
VPEGNPFRGHSPGTAGLAFFVQASGNAQPQLDQPRQVAWAGRFGAPLEVQGIPGRQVAPQSLKRQRPRADAAWQITDGDLGAYFIIALHLRPQQAGEQRMPLDLLAGHGAQDRNDQPVQQDFHQAKR